MKVSFDQNGMSAEMNDESRESKGTLPGFFSINSDKKCMIFGILSFVLFAMAIIVSAFVPEISSQMPKGLFTLSVSLATISCALFVFGALLSAISIVCFFKSKKEKKAYVGITCAILGIASIAVRVIVYAISFLTNVIYSL